MHTGPNTIACTNPKCGTCKPEFCPDSKDGEHHADMDSVGATHEKGSATPAVYLDVNCADCGRSGCYGRFTPADPVDW